jgi:hypothetical protein
MLLELEYVEKMAVWGLDLGIRGFFAMESVLHLDPPGGGIEKILSLLPNGARKGELDVCEFDLKGDCLLVPASGGMRIMFLLDAAFLSGRSGDILRVLEALMDGIGA